MRRKSAKSAKKSVEFKKKPVRMISFIIPHRPEESFEKTVSLVRKIVKQTRIAAEIIIVSGNQPSVQRNRAVEKAKGDVLYFLDNDSIIDPLSLKSAIAVFNVDPKTAIVGGPSLTPESDSFLQQCFGIVLSSFFAVGPGIRSRYCSTGECRATDEYELILANMAIRRDVFMQIGGFNENIYPNEENVLINNIKTQGYRVVYHPQMVVYRTQRKNIAQFIRQMFTYGRGRSDQTFMQKQSFNIFSIIPAGFTLYMVFLPFTFFITLGGFMLYYTLPFILYIFLNIIFGAVTALEHKFPKSMILLPVLYFVVHFFYGTGIIWGTVKNIFSRGKKPRKKTWFKIEQVLR